MSETTSNKTCEGCGGDISPNQILARQAGLVNGVLLCPGCIAKKREELMRARAAQAPAHPAGAASTTVPAGAARAPAGRAGGGEGSGFISDENGNQGRVYFPGAKGTRDEADKSLSLIDETEVTNHAPHQIRSFSEGSTLSGGHKDQHFKRSITPFNEPATRCRTFHGKLTAAGLAHMDEQINEWLDSHTELYIKSSSSTVGVFEGKTKEPHLLVTVFY